MKAEQIALQIDPKAKKVGEEWLLRCPAHDDNNPSFNITDGNNPYNPTFFCHAGCPQERVIGVLQNMGLWERPDGKQTPERARAKQAWEAENAAYGELKAIMKENEGNRVADATVEYLNYEYIPEDPSDQITSLDAFMALEFPPETPLLGPINKGTINIFGGLSGVGKSLFAHSIASAISRGAQMAHWRNTIGPQATLLIDGEMSGSKLQKRIRDMAEPPRYDIVTSSMLLSQGRPRIDLTDMAHHDQWVASMKDYAAVVMDNVYTLFPTSVSMPSTGAEYWQHVEVLLHRLKEQGTSVILLDHLNDTGRRLAGTTNKRWAADLVGILYRDPTLHKPERAEFTLKFGYESGGKIRDDYQTAIHADTDWYYEGGIFKSIRDQGVGGY